MTNNEGAGQMSDDHGARCGFTTLTLDGVEEPCDRPPASWRWYQGHEHEDCLDRACVVHENPGGIRMAALEAEVRDLRAKVEAAGADRLEAKREALREARAQATWPVATAEQWRYDRTLWIFAIMLGEIPEDTPAPPSPGEPGFAAAYPVEARLLGITT